MTDDVRPFDSTGVDAPDPGRASAARTEPRTPVGVMDPEVQATLRQQRSSAISGWGWPSGTAPETPIEGVPSTAAIAGHPLHPMLVPVPIGLFVAALASDLAYAASRDRVWARASRALTVGGVASGLLSAAFGLTDFVTRQQIRDLPIAWLHAGGNVLVVTIGMASIAARARDPERAVLPVGLALSTLSGGLLLLTGWLGGELVFRHRIGLAPRSEAMSSSG